MEKQAQYTAAQRMHDEHILVVPREKLFFDGDWQGFKAYDESFDTRIHENKEFQPRSAMEHDPRYKQIIPYLIFTHNERYFLMQRTENAGEQRLKNKSTLGIGGHIRSEDVNGTDIAQWAYREFHEEVSYEGSVTIAPFGIINDDSNDVGRVHLAYVYLVHGNSDEISTKEEVINGTLLSLEECKVCYPSLEGWSQIILDELLKHR